MQKAACVLSPSILCLSSSLVCVFPIQGHSVGVGVMKEKEGDEVMAGSPAVLGTASKCVESWISSLLTPFALSLSVGTRLCLSSGEKVVERMQEQSPVSALVQVGLGWLGGSPRQVRFRACKCGSKAWASFSRHPQGDLVNHAVGEWLRFLPLSACSFLCFVFFHVVLDSSGVQIRHINSLNEQHNRYDLSTRNTLYGITEPPAQQSDNSSYWYSYPCWRQSRNYKLFREFTKNNGCKSCNSNIWSWKQCIKQIALFREGSYKTTLHSFIIRQLFRIHVPFKIINYIQNSSF